MPFTTIDQFKQQFGTFCQTANVDSGKGNSYACGIWYLYEYLLHTHETNSTLFNAEVAELIFTKRNAICNSNSAFFQNFRDFLIGRHQKTYLTKGFIKAALPYLEQFLARDNI